MNNTCHSTNQPHESARNPGSGRRSQLIASFLEEVSASTQTLARTPSPRSLRGSGGSSSPNPGAAGMTEQRQQHLHGRSCAAADCQGGGVHREGGCTPASHYTSMGGGGHQGSLLKRQPGQNATT
ncbi:hypothetical protein JOB18_027095 [Solea senegalensis]|uniref:Uncharacterized protein n=1 Tax=Solea senegalensis TaxID=28829 RepID=A0AAV6RZ47_SOLSE|nr:hypothetical protein JOB18_027095 [Solea senegalensis]